MLEDYPKGSGRLRDHILGTGGTIVSEYLPMASYSAENFVQRNRLQAALGRILIPAEWNRRSGTAHTVRFATSLGRPIACLRLRSEEHTSELQSLMRISYAVFCLKKKNKQTYTHQQIIHKSHTQIT